MQRDMSAWRELLNFNSRPLDDVEYVFACFLKLKQNLSWLQLCDGVGIAQLLNGTKNGYWFVKRLPPEI